MPKNETTRNLAYYMDLPYTTILRKDEEGDVVARVEELPGCVSHGQNEAEAVENLASMKKLWFEDCLESGEDIPEPEKREPPSSGKWVQRVPRSLHRELTRMAKTEGKPQPTRDLDAFASSHHEDGPEDHEKHGGADARNLPIQDWSPAELDPLLGPECVLPARYVAREI
jgi:antitoxin HicB